MTELAQRWRAARPLATGLHFDSAACSRQSFAAIDAAAAHARREAEVGGYVAAEEAECTLAAGRAGIATLTGMSSGDVVFTTGATRALDLLLGSWVDKRQLIACLPGEFGPNLSVMSANGFEVLPFPTDPMGRVSGEDVEAHLAAKLPTLVHLTAVPSHRGITQPLAEIAEACRARRVPLVVDAAQALGQIDCAVGADAIYSTSRKWLAGPRGVGVLAVRPELAERLRPRFPSRDWAQSMGRSGEVHRVDLSAMQRLELGEANIAARVAFSVAVEEHLSAGPQAIAMRLAEVGRLAREALAELKEWRVVEPVDSPTAITTLKPLTTIDVERVRSELISQHGIVTTVAGVERAPLELVAPVLRLSPHVDLAEEQLHRFAEGLSAVCAR